MTDSKRLERSLARLGSRRQRSRNLDATDRPLLAAVLTEADDTIMERHLGFTRDDGASFGLIVANRRIMGITASADAPATEAVNHLIGTGIGAEDKDELARLAAWFDGQLAGAARLGMITRPLPRDQMHASVGVAVAVLAQALGVSMALEPDARATPAADALIGAFRARIDEISRLWVALDQGSLCGHSGAEPDAGLQAMAAAGPFATGLTVTGDARRLLVDARAGGQQVLAVCDAGAATAVAQAWHAAVTG